MIQAIITVIMLADNKVYIAPEGYIEVDIIGNQTPESFQEINDKVRPLIEKLTEENKPLLGLVDMSAETGYSISSDKAALQLLEDINYTKLAMYNPPHIEVVKGIIMAMGRSENTKIFDDRNEALAWLLA